MGILLMPFSYFSFTPTANAQSTINAYVKGLAPAITQLPLCRAALTKGLKSLFSGTNIATNAAGDIANPTGNKRNPGDNEFNGGTNMTPDYLNDFQSTTPPVQQNTSSCAKAGELFSDVYKDYPATCCEGLTKMYTGMDTSISVADKCYETNRLSGNPVGTCTNCGNGICEKGETVCNCPSDCIGKSKYLTVQDFCNKGKEPYCGEFEQGTELCKLCTNNSQTEITKIRCSELSTT
jgi:hypothetical protein